MTDKIPQLQQSTIDGIELFPKQEYHISLVSLDKICVGKAQKRKLFAALTEFFRNNLGTVSLTSIDKCRYLCHKGGKDTLIAMANIRGLQEMWAVVTQFIPNAPPPFPHVTLLMSKEAERGIGLHSKDDLLRYCREVHNM
ncbi:MAG: hypothetical protein Q4A34_01110 [Candidatus Saccharibacteria bacterium]|nr:hypothetical protein [Candidatus Saccharibacteria bacterium]